MAFDSQSILNADWYNRLISDIKNQTTAGIRGSGSRADDPYYAAKQAQGLGDLANQRQDAVRRMVEGGNAMRGNSAEADAAYQRRATWGLKNMNPQGTNPSTYLGTQANEPTLPGEMDTAEAGAGLGVAPVAPSSDPRANSLNNAGLLRGAGVMSGQQKSLASGVAAFGKPATPSIYNPNQFDHAGFDYTKEQKRINDMTAMATQSQFETSDMQNQDTRAALENKRRARLYNTEAWNNISSLT